MQHFGNEAAYRQAKTFFADDPSTNRGTHVAVGDQPRAGQTTPRLCVPGGQTPVVDLTQDPDEGEILRHFHTRGKPDGAVTAGNLRGFPAMRGRGFAEGRR